MLSRLGNPFTPPQWFKDSELDHDIDRLASSNTTMSQSCPRTFTLMARYILLLILDRSDLTFMQALRWPWQVSVDSVHREDVQLPAVEGYLIPGNSAPI